MCLPGRQGRREQLNEALSFLFWCLLDCLAFANLYERLPSLLPVLSALFARDRARLLSELQESL